MVAVLGVVVLVLEFILVISEIRFFGASKIGSFFGTLKRTLETTNVYQKQKQNVQAV